MRPFRADDERLPRRAEERAPHATVRLVRLTLLFSLLGLACAPMPPKQTAPTVTPLPDFTLLDVNPASATSGQQVGPVTLRGKVSGWYFTHSS